MKHVALLFVGLVSFSSCVSMNWSTRLAEPELKPLKTASRIGVLPFEVSFQASDNKPGKLNREYGLIDWESPYLTNSYQLSFLSPKTLTDYAVTANEWGAMVQEAWIAMMTGTADFDYRLLGVSGSLRIRNEGFSRKEAALPVLPVIATPDRPAAWSAEALRAYGQQHQVDVLLVGQARLKVEVCHSAARNLYDQAGSRRLTLAIGDAFLLYSVQYEVRLYDAQTGLALTPAMTSSPFSYPKGLPIEGLELNETARTSFPPYPKTEDFLYSDEYRQALKRCLQASLVPYIPLFRYYYLAEAD